MSKAPLYSIWSWRPPRIMVLVEVPPETSGAAPDSKVLARSPASWGPMLRSVGVAVLPFVATGLGGRT